MNLNHSRNVVKRTIRMLVIVFTVLLISGLNSAETEIASESPDKERPSIRKVTKLE